MSEIFTWFWCWRRCRRCCRFFWWRKKAAHTAHSWSWSCSWPCPSIQWAHLLLVQWAPSIDGRWRVAAAVAGRGDFSLRWRLRRNRWWRVCGGGVLGCWRRRRVAVAGWHWRAGRGGASRGAVDAEASRRWSLDAVRGALVPCGCGAATRDGQQAGSGWASASRQGPWEVDTRYSLRLSLICI
jgi:hypothetical protein